MERIIKVSEGEFNQILHALNIASLDYNVVQKARKQYEETFNKLMRLKDE